MKTPGGPGAILITNAFREVKRPLPGPDVPIRPEIGLTASSQKDYSNYL